MPIPIRSISTEEHPVKVGLSDAYYNDTYVPEYSKFHLIQSFHLVACSFIGPIFTLLVAVIAEIKRRTIYEYHKVLIRTEAVTSGSVVVLKPLPSTSVNLILLR